jgi:hypothetical protein
MSQPNEMRLRSRVLGRLEEDFITVIMGYGQGHMDGGQPTPVPIDLIPPTMRMPNSEFDVILQLRPWKILRIEPISAA